MWCVLINWKELLLKDSDHAYQINDWFGGIRAPTPPQKQDESDTAVRDLNYD